MSNPDDVNFQFLAEHSADVICRVGLDNVIRYASPSCVHVLGWTVEEMIGMGPAELVIAEDLPTIAAAVARNHTPGARGTTATVRMRVKNGPPVWVETSARLVRNSVTGEPMETVLVMRDISERKLVEEKLQAEALTDGLTGLANRRAFDQALERDWKRTLREGSQMSLLLLDVDHFKRFNDQYGHQCGDDCLRAVAAAIRSAVRREIDVVARYGGEEIAVILACTGSEGALLMAEKVRRAVENLRIPHVGSPEGGGLVTASVGVATALARNGGTMKMPESILMSADHALYKAKFGGRNRVETTLLMAAQSGAEESAHVSEAV
jgi:diguanylate cyclase (GGDEF)-like protein/PAS domain S-box-containing protein